MTDDEYPYGEGFYREHLNDEHQRAMNAIAMALDAELHPFSVVDFGCGVGAILDYFRTGPRATVLGYEHPRAIKTMKETGSVLPLEMMCPVDLCRSDLGGATSVNSLGICIEVAEHIPRECHTSFFRFITSGGDTLFFSGAFPGQGGTGHIAEAPAQYWEKQLNDRGFYRDEEATERIIAGYRDFVGGLWWYAANCRLYRRRA